MKDAKKWIVSIVGGVILVWVALIMTKRQTLAHRMVDVRRKEGKKNE